MLIRTYVIDDFFRIGNRQLFAGCRFELAFFLNGNSRIRGRVGDMIGFR